MDLSVDRADTGGGRVGGLLVHVRGLQVLKLDVEATLLQTCKFLVGDITVYLLYRLPSRPPESIS